MRRFLIILVALAAFAAVVAARWALERPSQLERIISANEPNEHVHTLTVAPDGTFYIGTHLGLLAGKGGRNWARVPGIDGDVLSAAATASGQVVLALADVGAARYSAAGLEPLLPGHVQAVAIDPADASRILAITSGSLLQSRDGGRTWAVRADFGFEQVLALAIHPLDPAWLIAAGLTGAISISRDGGHHWTLGAALPGTVSALAFEPTAPHRLWAAAGGLLRVAEDPSVSWRTAPGAPEGRAVVALGFAPAKAGGPTAVTADGYLFQSK